MKVDSMDATSSQVRGYASNTQVKVRKFPEGAAETEKQEIRIKTKMSEVERRELPIPDRVVLESLERANLAIAGTNRHFEFSFHEKTNDIMVKVIDTNTSEVIREIPPEKILDLVANLMEMAGLLVDERR